MRLAPEVDHIVPHAEGGTDEDTNLEAICSQHHRAKTAEESKRGIRRASGLEAPGG